MVKIFLRVVLLGLLWVAGGVVNAGPISAGIWYQFSFDTTGTPSDIGATGCPNTAFDCISIPGTTFAGTPPWTFTVGSGGATLKVTDAFQSGDVFRVFENLNPLGITDQIANSIIPIPTGCDPLSDPTDPADPNPCFGGPDLTFGEFLLGAGPKSIMIDVESSIFGFGTGFFRVDDNIQSIPTPGTLALTLLALFGLGWTQLKNRGAATNRRVPINLG